MAKITLAKITLWYKVIDIEDVAADRYGIACRSQAFRFASYQNVTDFISADPAEPIPSYKIIIIKSYMYSHGPVTYHAFQNQQLRKEIIYDNLQHITKMIRQELEDQGNTKITGIDWQYYRDDTDPDSRDWGLFT